MERLKGMELTGSPNDDDFNRYATSLYNSGSAMTSHLYDVIRNAESRIDNLFPFLKCSGCPQTALYCIAALSILILSLLLITTTPKKMWPISLRMMPVV
jgi:hypothetical protein